MSKTIQTQCLEKQLYSTTIKRGVFGTFEVTLGWYGKERVDFMTYDCKDIFRCYEIKVSAADFHSNAKVSFVGNYNYYVMTEELWIKVKSEIPNDIGVYIGSENDYYEYNGKEYWKPLTLVKRPKRRELGMGKDVLFGSLIRCLHRDAEKYLHLSEDLKNIENIKKEYESEIRSLKKLLGNAQTENFYLTYDLRKIYGNDFARDFQKKRMEMEE